MPDVGLTLDAGALTGLEWPNRRLDALLDRGGQDLEIRVPAGVLAQVLRPGGRQARLHRLLRAAGTTVVPLDEAAARLVSVLLARSRTTDVLDASVVVCAAQHRDIVLTSDPDDLLRLEPRLPLRVV